MKQIDLIGSARSGSIFLAAHRRRRHAVPYRRRRTLENFGMNDRVVEGVKCDGMGTITKTKSLKMEFDRSIR